MKFFVDTADVTEIRALIETGFIDGVTTNPTLVAHAHRRFEDILAEICALVPGPVSAEVTATDLKDMLIEGRYLAKIAPNITIKVPLTPDGLKACRALTQEGTSVNVTLCFSAAQAILAAKAGATFISPFIGRLDDVGTEGMALIDQIVNIYKNYPDFKTQVLAASIRSPLHVVEAARLGADVVTLPPRVLRQLYNHPLTDKGLSDFLADWKKSGQKIVTS
ncbi:MAG: fructose-6-phosphate aldolase [Alphaproteobacteria bacterium]|jgi:transaldolase|nr:fructose-6-phosphate aldolase [Alphaproteobacteria bacterium]MBP9776996.1 fructose-6-phosphate aldolase [Alphaproteobacteria bacterium]